MTVPIVFGVTIHLIGIRSSWALAALILMWRCRCAVAGNNFSSSGATVPVFVFFVVIVIIYVAQLITHRGLMWLNL